METNKYSSINQLLEIPLSKLEKWSSSPKNCLNPYKCKYLNLKRGELTILASGLSVEKTVLALNWIRDFAARQNKPIGYISSGIPDSEYVVLRLLSLESKVNHIKIRNDYLKESDIRQIEDACSKLSELPFFIRDIPNAKYRDIECIATEMVRKNKIEILFIDGFDYLYEIAVSKSFCKNAQWAEQMEPYYNEIYIMMENLKGLANKLQIPIVLLVPVKQDAYGDEPTIKSFEDKLIIPRIANKVIFLHRERINIDDEWQDAKLIVAKNSNGPCGDVIIRFCCKTGEFKYDEKEEN